VKRTFALALPVMFGRAGLLMAITVALVVVGHAGPNDQAYFAAGFAPHMLVLVFGMGLVAGVTVLSAQANGAGNAQQCGRIWRLGLLLAAACGIGAAVCCGVAPFCSCRADRRHRDPRRGVGAPRQVRPPS
jgi:MATE family multidrug resistance protein